MGTSNLEQWQGEAEEAAQYLREQAQSTTNGLQEKARHWQRQTVAQMRRLGQTADGYVHTSPWISIASVAAACFAVGFILGMKRK